MDYLEQAKKLIAEVTGPSGEFIETCPWADVVQALALMAIADRLNKLISQAKAVEVIAAGDLEEAESHG